jgi:asparagine synthase (glutamine-hydrolysing)
VEVPDPEVSIPEAWLNTIDRAIVHRGPDGQGRFRDRIHRTDGATLDVAFVHRRLAVIDQAGGSQPMISERGSNPDEGLVAVVFNGCIYNHRLLRRELEAKGRVFSSDHSDTEVIIHGWREWGERLPEHLDGMFAFVLWDRAGTLLLARDWFGEKPLYAFHVAKDTPAGGGWINAFASVPLEATPLRAALGESSVAVLPQSSMINWLRFGWGISSPATGGRAVSPGSTVMYRAADSTLSRGATAKDLNRLLRPKSRRYDMPVVSGSAFPERCDVADPDQIEQLLHAAVQSRLESDVEVGCFLSGGVDSSLIALSAARAGAASAVRAFTVKMPVAEYDESLYAAEVAKTIGVKLEVLECDPSPAQDLVDLITTMGLPFGDSSLLPTHWLSRTTRRHVKVALSGDGGDELFGGYDRYRAAAWASLHPPFGEALGSVLQGPSPKAWPSRVGRFLDAASNLGYWDLLSIFPESMLRKLVDDRVALDAHAATFARHPVVDSARAMSVDLLNYLPFDLLRKTDSASMRVALEVRCPMLAPALAHAAMSASTSSLTPAGQRKGLLRQIARKHLPAEVVDRPKQGFAIPIGDWFRTDYGGMKTMLLDHLNSAEPWPNIGVNLNRRFVLQMLDEHMGMKRDHSQRLYMLLVLSIWAKAFLV